MKFDHKDHGGDNHCRERRLGNVVKVRREELKSQDHQGTCKSKTATLQLILFPHTAVLQKISLNFDGYSTQLDWSKIVFLPV